MLLKLHIQNLILIETQTLQFGPGLNILSGETGAGKSAILLAICLILGKRSDLQLIRKDCEKCIVEAFFDVTSNLSLIHFLEECGIDHDKEEILCIRRELNQNGKNRCFINHQLVQLTLLEKVGNYLVDLVLQHAYHKLFSHDYQLQLLDDFAQNHALLMQYKETWNHFSFLKKTHHELASKKEKGFHASERIEKEIKEIQEAKLLEDEEEELFLEYQELLKNEEKSEKINGIIATLFDGKVPLLTILNKQKNQVESLSVNDEQFITVLESFESITCELNELSYTLNSFAQKLEFNPKRVQFLEERLSLYEHLKKKYGQSIEQIHLHLALLEKQKAELESIDQNIDEIERKLKVATEEIEKLSLELTERRGIAAKVLSAQIEKEVKELNIPNAIFIIEMIKVPLYERGAQSIEFKFAPNLGEALISIKECASGGELSRLMLAIKTALCEKEKLPTLIFDEIDANMGGETGSIMGEKIKEISKNAQILCITHLAQVAQFASTHFLVQKIEKEGRTFSIIEELTDEGREKELKRMLGGKSFHELARKMLK